MHETLIRMTETEIEVCVEASASNRDIMAFVSLCAPERAGWKINHRDADSRSRCAALRDYVHIILTRDGEAA